MIPRILDASAPLVTNMVGLLMTVLPWVMRNKLHGGGEQQFYVLERQRHTDLASDFPKKHCHGICKIEPR